mmetsp:Transcript_16802/g.47996  ORF Transcript_16802/g.47996 Transcript_16802/m.47996 type:complete len:261 (+) Transcript_16802:1119-1901(+)
MRTTPSTVSTWRTLRETCGTSTTKWYSIARGSSTWSASCDSRSPPVPRRSSTARAGTLTPLWPSTRPSAQFPCARSSIGIPLAMSWAASQTTSARWQFQAARLGTPFRALAQISFTTRRPRLATVRSLEALARPRTSLVGETARTSLRGLGRSGLTISPACKTTIRSARRPASSSTMRQRTWVSAQSSGMARPTPRQVPGGCRSSRSSLPRTSRARPRSWRTLLVTSRVEAVLILGPSGICCLLFGRLNTRSRHLVTSCS